MKSIKSIALFSIAAAGLMLAGTTAKADPLTITLANDFLTATPGETITFYGTLTNSTSHWEWLNQGTANIDSDPGAATPLLSSATDVSDYFYVNFPLYLIGNETSTGGEVNPASDALFTVIIPDGTSLGVYTGTFEIDGGRWSGASRDLATVDFSVDVVPTPEPSSLLLMLGGLVGIASTLRRRLVRSSSTWF